MKKKSDDTVDKFKQIYSDYPEITKERGRTTESDTRANILDRIIHEVLEWPRTSVEREPFANPGFIDYLFNIGRPKLLLEAKAQGIAFSLPYRKKARRRLKVSGTLFSDDEVKEAILQAQGYCNDTGTKFACITNGYSFIVLRAITEGKSWKDEQAVVFRDVKDITTHWTEFWNVLRGYPRTINDNTQRFTRSLCS